MCSKLLLYVLPSQLPERCGFPGFRHFKMPPPARWVSSSERVTSHVHSSSISREICSKFQEHKLIYKKHRFRSLARSARLKYLEIPMTPSKFLNAQKALRRNESTCSQAPSETIRHSHEARMFSTNRHSHVIKEPMCGSQSASANHNNNIVPHVIMWFVKPFQIAQAP